MATFSLTHANPVNLGTVPVSAVSFASLSLDRTAGGGINAAGTATSILLEFHAVTATALSYQIAACTMRGGGTQGTAALGVSTYGPETSAYAVATMTSAAVPFVMITPVVTAQAVA